MPDPKILLLAALLALTAAFVLFWIAQERARPNRGPLLSGLHALIGFLTNFFDTLGIGSFATTTTIYRLWGWCPFSRCRARSTWATHCPRWRRRSSTSPS